MQVAAHDDNTVADAPLDGERPEDDHRRICDLLVPIDLDILADRNARAGQPVCGDFRQLRCKGHVHRETRQDDRQ